MKAKLLGFVLFLFVQYNVFGQAAASSNYNSITGNLGTTYSWIDCSLGTNIITGDDTQAAKNWPFNFKFYDNNYTTANSLSIATNGFIRLDGVAAGGNYTGAIGYNLISVPSTNFGQIIAMGIYDDYVGRIPATSWVRSLVTGTAPNRIFTIEYNNLEISYSAGKYADIQVSFYESTNKVVLKYGADDVTQAGADIGIHSGVANYFHKWQEVASGTNNTWIEYTPANIEVNATIGTLTAYYSTLRAAFDKINSGTHQGSITIKVKASTTEGLSAILNASGTGSSNYTAVNIYPTISGLSISGNLAAPLIDLTGADNVVIDGSVNASGSAKDLIISNTNTGTSSSTIRFGSSAENNTVKNCTVKGSGTNTAGGVFLFSSSATGNGNDNNLINNNNITSSVAGRPVNAIYSSGTSGRENNANTISNNYIYDFFNTSLSSRGINIGSNSVDWIVSGNSFYETTTISPTAANNYYVIYTGTTTSHLISGNYFGGSAPQCGGSPWTMNSSFPHTFYVIFISGGLTTPVTVQNNVIQNMNYTSTNSNPWDGINIPSGNSNVTGNTIGSTTGTNSIVVTSPNAAATSTITGGVVTAINLVGGGSGFTTAPLITFTTAGSTTQATATAIISGGVVTGFTITNGGAGYTSAPNVIFNGASYSTTHGIRHTTTGAVTISNNTIGAITVQGTATYSHCFEGIVISGGAASVNITNNLIGSLTTANSIHASVAAASSLNKQEVRGIFINNNVPSSTISGNTIANLYNAYTGTSFSRTDGISSSGGGVYQNNIIRNITADGDKVLVKGIAQFTNSGGGVQITGNTISYISNLSTSASSVLLVGIDYAGTVTGTNNISKNFIHNLSVSSGHLGSQVMGIYLGNGVATCSNNIINVGGILTLGYSIYGIYDNSSASSANVSSLYFNSVYIGGTVASGTTSSTAALWNSNNISIRNYRNNILMNARSGGTSGKHYAIRIAGTSGLTVDYNDYYVSGTGGVLGYLGSDKTTLALWKTATSQDANSLNIDPLFASAGSTTSSDYTTSATLPGVVGTGILTDYNEITRNNPPKMGALELTLGFVWQGNTSTNFANASNWVNGDVPTDGADISFAVTPANDCYLDQNRTLKNITNTSAKKFVVNGKQFTLTGAVIEATANQIDATSTSSTVVFAGTAAQVIPAVVFLSNTLDGLTLNNSNGLSQNGAITVQTLLTLTNGDYTIGANTLSLNGSVSTTAGTLIGGSTSDISIGGSGASTNLLAITLNNLTLNRLNGIGLGGNVSVGGTLALTLGTLTVSANTLTISGNAPTRNSGNIDASNAGASLVFTNSSTILLPASIFTGAINNLTINGAGITAGSDFTVDGVLNLQNANPSSVKGSLDMSSYILSMGVNSTTIGIGDVIGIVKRAHTFTGAIEYTFGNQYTSIVFSNVVGGIKPAWISCKIAIGTSPSWRTEAINRVYSFAQDGTGTDRTVTRLHYLDTELHGTETDESKLVFWDAYTGPTFTNKFPRSKSNSNASENWVELIGMAINFIATSSTLDIKQWGLSYTNVSKKIWTGNGSPTYAGDWSLPGNWNGGVPLSIDDVLIPAILPSNTNGYPTRNLNSVTVPAVAKTIEIEPGASITVDTYNISVSGDAGAWINNGTFNAGTGKVIFNHGVPAEIVTISGITNFYNIEVGANTTFQPTTGNILRIAGAGTADVTSFVDFSIINNTIEWNGANQTIVNPNGIGGYSGYYKLILSGSGTKTMPTTAMSIRNEFIISGTASATAQSALTIGSELEILSGASFATGAFDHIVGGHFDNAGTFTTTAGTTITLNGTAVQNVYGGANINFENLIINNSTSVDIFSDVNVNDVLTLTNGNLNVGTTTLSINGDIVKTAGFLEVNSLSSLTFGGTTALTLPNALFVTTPSINNLTINRTGGVIASSDFTINGILSLQSANPLATRGCLEMTISYANYPGTTISDYLNSYILNMGTTSTTIGIGDVTGTVRRTTILENTPYTFGHQYTTVSFTSGGILPTALSVSITIGNTPPGPNGTDIIRDAIKRTYEIVPTGGSGSFVTANFHYLDSELTSSLTSYVNSELNVTTMDYDIGGGFPNSDEHGRANYDSDLNYIGLSSVPIEYFIQVPTTHQWRTIFAIRDFGEGYFTWNGSVSSDWNIPQNWTLSGGGGAGVPTTTGHVIIPDGATTPNDSILPTGNTMINTLSIRNGGILIMGNNTLTIENTFSGGWEDLNLLGNDPGTSKIIFSTPNTTISGNPRFYNVEIGNGADITNQLGSIIKIENTILKTGTGKWYANSFENTVIYNKLGDQLVIVPDLLSSYYNLILSGSGTKTMPAAPMNINGNFSTSGTATASAANAITVIGSTTIESGSTFETGNFNHLLAGNFENNGTLNAASGGIITFNGTMAQTVSGTSTSSLENLIIENIFGVTLTSNIAVNNVLLLNSGNLIVGNATLGINGTISNPSGAIEVSAVSNLSFGGTVALTINNNLFTSAPSINDLTINRSGGVTLGNQSMDIGGTLALTSGTFTLMANTLTLSGNSPTRISGNIDASNSSAEMAFTNSSSITLLAGLFSGSVANFKVNGSGGVSSNENIALTGILNLESANPSATKGSLDMTSTLELSMGASATTIGIGDVTGIVKREHTFTGGIEYSFGNQFTSLNFLNVSGGIKPTWVKCKIAIGTVPTWRGEAIKRYYSFAQSGGTDRVIAKLHYLDSELHDAETDETQLVYWDAYDPAFAANNFIKQYARSYNNRDINDNWVQLNGPAINYLATSDLLDVKQWGLSYSYAVHLHTWTGNGSPSYDGDWSLPGNWKGGVPNHECPVLIPNPADLPSDNNGDLNPYRNLLPIIAPSEAKSVEIVAGATLSATHPSETDYDITVYGDTNAWVNNGTFIPGVATVIFANGDPVNAVSIAGTTNFYNVTVNDKTWLQPATGSVIGIGHIISFIDGGSILDFTTNNNTIDYNGTSQTVINPNGGTTGYYNLSLSGSGIKTLPITTFNILGNLSLSGSAVTTTTSDLIVGANLNLSGTSIVTIGAAKTLTVSGAIANTAGSGGLVLQSNINGTASLIHNTTNVPATVQRYISGAAEDWHFLSSPVSDQPFSGSWLPSGTYGNGTGYDMYVWDEPTPCWVYKLNTTVSPNWPTVHPSANFVQGRGYLYSVQALNPTKEFVGNLNNGSITYPITANNTVDPLLTGFNLIGNPYPSAIDWKASAGWTRSNLLNSGGGYDMWIWNPVANNYGVFNSFTSAGTNSVTQYIAPMQGFFVRAASNANIGMTNDIRLHTGASNWMKLSNNKNNLSNLKVRIASGSGLGFDEVLLQFGYGSNAVGAAKLFSATKTAPSTYFKVGKEELSVRYLTNTTDNPIVPLMFKPGGDGNYTLSIGQDYKGFDYIVLEDKKAKIFHNLIENPTYEFKGLLKDNPSRFILHFTPKESISEDNLSALIYYNGNDIVLDLTDVQEKTEVKIYDILGRLILNKTLEANSIQNFPMSKTTQMLIVEAKSKSKIKKCKVLIY